MTKEINMKESKIYHINDRTMKYLTLAQTKRQHQYLGLPGEFKTRLAQEIVYPNLTSARADELYCTNENLLIDLEEESGEITEKTLMKFAKYIIFAGYRHTHNIYLAVICHKDPKKDFECFKISPSLYLKVHYYHFSQNELWIKYENIICKVKQKERLTETEALDIAFVSKFISQDYALEIIESLTEAYKNALIEDAALKLDIGVILGGMILKRIQNTKKQNRLLRRINMRHIENEIEKLVYDEYGDILDKKDEELEAREKEITRLKNTNKEYENKTRQLNNTNKEYKNKIKQLKELKDLTPEAKKIINTMMLL